MTIALGILANDGFLVAADRQETIPGYWKNDVSKLFAMSASSPKQFRYCLLSGSGTAHYIDAFRDQLFRRVKLSDTPEQTTEGFSALLAEFYGQHVLPFAAYPAAERPDFQILTAFSCIGGTRARPRLALLTSEESVFKQHHRYAAVGSGSMLAMSLMNRFYEFGEFDLREALLVSVYVMSHVKDSIDGCGKETDIAGVCKGVAFSLSSLEINDLEKAIRGYMDFAEPAALGLVLRRKYPSIARRAVDQSLKEARKVLKKISLDHRLTSRR